MTSVAICTYNRSDSLRKTLASFVVCQVPPGLDWEVLVVDNASTDETGDVVAEFTNRLPLRSCLESRQGLSQARNRAVAETVGSDLLLFTDDDVRVEPGWITAYCEAADFHPEADFFGGRVKPLFQGGTPEWLRDENMDLLDGLFVNYDRGARSREITSNDPLPIGASMGFRHRCFADQAQFRVDLGVSGQSLGRGEDTEFLGRILRTGGRGYYVADALGHHEVAPERLSYGYAFRYGMACQSEGGSRFRALGFLLRGFRQCLLGRGDRARQCAIRAGMEWKKEKI